MKRTFVKLYRDIQETPVYSNPELLKVYLHCLLNAAHKTNYVEMATGRGKTTVTIHTGELLWGRLSASEKLNLSPSKCERHLKRLAKLGYILRKTYKHFSKITLLLDVPQNTDIQEDIKKGEQAMNRQRTGNEQAMNTYNKVKNVKNKEEKAPPKIEDQKTQYTGGGSIAIEYQVKSLFIQAGAVCLDSDIRHCKTIAYAMRDIIKQKNKDSGRPSNDQIKEGVKAVFDNLPEWVKAKGFFSPSGIARNMSAIVNDIRSNSNKTTATKKIDINRKYM